MILYTATTKGMGRPPKPSLGQDHEPVPTLNHLRDHLAPPLNPQGTSEGNSYLFTLPCAAAIKPYLNSSFGVINFY